MRSLFVLMLMLAVMTSFGQEFRVGAAKRSVQPDHLIPISGGIGKPVMPTAKAGELSARALVLAKGETRVAIASIDNLGWPAYLGNAVRKLVKGIKPENILIAATHAHSAPDAYGFPDESGKNYADTAYLRFCVRQLAAAINEAAANLEPAVLKTAVGEAKGKIAYNYYAEKLYDQRCGVIQAIATSGNRKGQNIATLVNYATHPEILGTSRLTLSPDLCGPLYDRIESKGGGTAIFVNSAQGGMVTADNRRENGKEANDWDECIRIGNLLADEALRIVEGEKPQENPGLYCTSQVVGFPVENPVMKFIMKNTPFAPSYAEKGEQLTINTTMNLLNIGKAQVVTIPGEALPNIGFYLKRKMKGSQPMLFGLTNDAFGYMMTKVDYQSFERYNYISRTTLGEMTGEILIDNALKLISQNPAPGE